MVYEQHTWQSNDLVTAEKLNNMENGIAYSQGKVSEIEEAITPFAITITAGQWSGTGSDRYITVNASNVTENSILIPRYDHASAAVLNGPVWCVPDDGSFTIHTTAIPDDSVTIVVLFAGTMGEAQYQVLADVYSTSQAVAKADVVNNLTIDDATGEKPAGQHEVYELNQAMENIIKTRNNITGTTDANGNVYVPTEFNPTTVILFAWNNTNIFIPFYYNGNWYCRVQRTNAAGEAITNTSVTFSILYIE